MRGFLERVLEFSADRVETFGARRIAFGVFSTINYMLSMYGQTGSSFMRIITITAIILNFLLIFSDDCPPIFKKYIPVYWHFTLMFCLPFMTTCAILIDGSSMLWTVNVAIINIAIALILGVLLLDFSSFRIIFPMGIVMAIVVSYIFRRDVRLTVLEYLSYPSFYLALFIFSVILIFSRDKEKELNEKIKVMKMLAGAIAHEVRTSLCQIASATRNLKSRIATKNELTSAEQTKRLTEIEKKIQYIYYTIDMILTKLSDNRSSLSCEAISAKDLIAEAIEEYPFSEEELKLMHVDVENDFIFNINKQLMIRVIFNILENALQQIKTAERGEIFIAVKKNRKRSAISIKDTATGIDKSKIDKIFDPFVTYKGNGTGIGLSFCKKAISTMDGNLSCRSELGKYAEFIIEF